MPEQLTRKIVELSSLASAHPFERLKKSTPMARYFCILSSLLAAPGSMNREISGFLA